MLAVQADGSEIETMAREASILGRIQEAFRQHHGLQCEFVGPVSSLAIIDLLRHHPLETDDKIREALSGNICCCTGYENIVTAVRELASKRGPLR
ncbi:MULTISPECIES: 2Fe-2S iron-sulfur cluster-binding protein [Rhizobium]|uniref:Putative carbon-monoxide dehydrogenase protein n=1 Tax=Rhizobium etli (strain CIAT 652) TaxID=491916 RepID=B3Q262_RHIE6|nr:MULTISPECIES: 2Fe-2S iron-sulfur cluster-binding protein [Rhizobium]ACE93768.1 putative carbon-monoxide dehydrogenase protein [Rhizobium etli CIAT 652]OHV22713.1 carbon monoxide dehydrogenase [Rhizobium sp. RSm-3]RVU05517.1 carbon monoxide dehydrogenase [Rhizobium sp. RMa-01]WHO76569.1 2Fe-2S iron-sulfur cluster-binding protein [Rhizobium sp. BT03]